MKPPRPQRLDRLINDVDVFDRPLDARKIEITSIADNTEDVRPGTLFCCVIGATVDGHDLAAEAARRGAVALITQKDVDVDLPQVRVDDVRAAMAPIAAQFYELPARHLRLFAVTGTNGKTTVAHILRHILEQHRWKSAVIGTLTGAYTSPPALILQRMLAELREEHTNAVVMEVSSHALVQRRVDAIRFGVGIFTNLTQDHLDYHKTMSRYFEAKSMLFDPGRCEKAVVNVDDPYGRQLVDRLAVPLFPYSLEDAVDLQVGPSGSTFTWQGAQVTLPLIGEFNVSNALAAATAARATGVQVAVIVQALATVPPVPGRMELVDRGQSFTALVDFAHTPDGLEHVLQTLRPLADDRGGRLTVVFGCGGDRDVEKRPQMGAIAERLADVVVVTSDNPRSEDPSTIVDQIIAGTERPDDAVRDVDRLSAIGHAVQRAQPGDVVVVAGKGHETTQDIGGVKSSFDDRLVLAEAIDLAARSGGPRESGQGVY